MKIDKIEEFKSTYKKCKKQKSIIFKDSYDKVFLEPINQYYKSNLKNEKMVHESILKNFFTFIINRAEKWQKVAKKSKTFKRINAVNEIIDVSNKIIKELENYELNDYKLPSGIPGNLCSPYIIKSAYNLVFDIPKLNLRCYLIVSIKGTGIEDAINKNFDFAHYKLKNNSNYIDESIDKRQIYKISSIPTITIPSKIGIDVKIELFVSPNKFFSALPLFDIKKEPLLPNN